MPTEVACPAGDAGIYWGHPTKQEARMKFHEKLLALRKQRGLSQEGLGEELDVSRQTISKWEAGVSLR